ncbi:MAG: hypothetical protein ACE15E_10870 [Acidobacteriota bacterium]
MTTTDPVVVVLNTFSHLANLIRDLSNRLPSFGPKHYTTLLCDIIASLQANFEAEIADLQQSALGLGRIPERALSYLSQLRQMQQRLLPYIAETDPNTAASSFAATSSLARSLYFILTSWCLPQPWSLFTCPLILLGTC